MQIKKLEFNNLSLKEQVDYFNINLQSGRKINEICETIGVSYNTVRDRFSRNHYVYNKYSKQYECVEKMFPIDEAALEKALEKIVTKVFNPKKTDSSEVLKCDLDGKVVNRSFRVYDSVLQDFTRFCNDSKYNQYDILSKFILEGMKKYGHLQS
ncbi:MAG: hypothetical protein ACRCXT_01750 [Paraclostridium sp.]